MTTDPATEEPVDRSDRSEMTEVQFSEHLEFFGDTRVEWCDPGHSGPGWYMWSTDYPDEGSAFVSPNRAPFPALAKLLAAVEAQP